MNSKISTRFFLFAAGILVTALTGFIVPTQAQTSGNITGTVRSAAGTAIDYATVTLHRAADSSVVKTEFSDANGAFRFEHPTEGRYRVSAAQIGFARYWSEPFALPASGSLALPSIALQPSAATALKEVQVVGQKPLFERLADRTVVNVEGSTLAAGNTTLDVLARAPGVTVDGNDNLALRGRQGLLVLIDGKRQPMTGSELADYLRSLPADQLKSIELITNPPAKYDAQGGAGIIAINLKKDQRMGTNGALNASYGRTQYNKFTSGFSGNHRRKDLNIFTSVNYTRRRGFGIRNTYRYFYESQNEEAPVLQSTSDQRNRIESSDHFLIYKIGADFNLSKNTVLGGAINGFAVPNPRPNGVGTNTSTFYDAAGQVTDYYTALSRTEGFNPNVAGNLNFKHTFGAAGAGSPELTADVDYANYYTHRLQRQTTFFELSGRPTSTLTGDQTGELIIRAVKADYTQALSPKTNLEAGAKASQVSSDNDLLFENTVNDITTIDLGRTNRFKYDEIITAAYATLSHTINKLNLQAGLRSEQTVMKGRQLVDTLNFRRDYYQLFPSAGLKYTLNDKHELSASLSRRINRPSYRQLNPFRFVIDPTTSGKGNPDLRPETSYNVELSHTFKQKFTTGFSFSVTQDPITDVAQPESDSTTVSQYVNLNRQQYAALTLTAPLTPAKWWNIYNNVVLYYIHYQGSLAGTALNRGRGACSLSSNSTFTFGKGWGAELNGTYESRQRVGFFVFQPFGQVGVGVQKAVWEKRGNVKLAATDIFYTSPLRATSRYNNYQENLFLRRDSRAVTLSLSWKLGNDNSTATNRRSGAEDEKRRAQ
ncbi:TonB-dependent receptor [Hymenobacter sp. YC55]|uniref:TonB-dependent receptor domain-containing protein n=1 Tax=Hymenobacter sp. YC55 TaxID=3034019 RepID=UPI0023F9FBB8|nr:TonB-dependent receptor [Hymenobacter sp. YC55]MDF7810451.1 TonB-dependent receptor [Hymenobacter sp. YC55]